MYLYRPAIWFRNVYKFNYCYKSRLVCGMGNCFKRDSDYVWCLYIMITLVCEKYKWG
jgi:hypothetical protein